MEGWERYAKKVRKDVYLCEGSETLHRFLAAIPEERSIRQVLTGKETMTRKDPIYRGDHFVENTYREFFVMLDPVPT